MASFPNSIVPKVLKRGTNLEVDNNPSMYNALDFNRHLRELVAIEKFLIGDPTSGATQTGILDALTQIISILKSLTNNGLLGQYTGTVKPGDTITLPTNIITTSTSGAIAAAATTIPVVSITDLPDSGFITKFNKVDATTVGSPQMKNYSFGNSITHQEIISYTGKADSPARLLGCTRGLESTIAQEVLGSETALIVSGKASLFLYQKTWQAASDDIPFQFYIEHDAELKVLSELYAEADTLSAISTLIEIGWAMNVVSYYSDVHINEAPL
jgi:hypothetical protein